MGKQLNTYKGLTIEVNHSAQSKLYSIIIVSYSF